MIQKEDRNKDTEGLRSSRKEPGEGPALRTHRSKRGLARK